MYYFSKYNIQLCKCIKGSRHYTKVVRGYSKGMFIEEGSGRVIEKQTKTSRRRGVPSMCVRSVFLKNMLRFSKWISSTVFPIDHNEDWFFCTLLLSTTFFFLCTVHYFLCTFSAKMATYWLVIGNVYFVISS